MSSEMSCAFGWRFGGWQLAYDGCEVCEFTECTSLESAQVKSKVKVTIALTRIEQGNQAHIKGVGKGPSNTRLISGRVTASILAGTASAL